MISRIVASDLVYERRWSLCRGEIDIMVAVALALTMSSRIYRGLWSLLMIWHETDDDGRPGKRFGHFGPDRYEECERLALLIGMGVPWEGHRVEKALIVPAAHDLGAEQLELAI